LLVNELNRPSAADSLESPKMPLVVVLDNVRSLLNVGAVFRNADAFGAEELFLCGITGHPPDREIRKTALGAEESVKWHHRPDILPLLAKLRSKGYRLFAVEQATGSISLEQMPVDASEKICVIFGNEVEGVQQQVIDVCDGCIEIPQAGAKHSLNVSVSSGVVLWHYFSHFKSRTHV